MKFGERYGNAGLIGRRDAFHTGGVLVASWGRSPGEWVRFTDADCTVVEKCSRDESHGMIDPFLAGPLEDGVVWVMLNPDSMADLQHHFDLKLSRPPLESRITDHRPIPVNEYGEIDTHEMWCREEGCW